MGRSTGRCAALAGCSNTSTSISESLEGTALGPKRHEPQPFVVASRPSTLEYMPVGVTPPRRAIAPKTPAQLAAEQAALAGDAQRSQGLGAAAVAEGARVKATAPRPPVVTP